MSGAEQVCISTVDVRTVGRCIPVIARFNHVAHAYLPRAEWSLDCFIRRESLWRVHQAVFAVLALESEPVDPRL